MARQLTKRLALMLVMAVAMVLSGAAMAVELVGVGVDSTGQTVLLFDNKPAAWPTCVGYEARGDNDRLGCWWRDPYGKVMVAWRNPNAVTFVRTVTNCAPGSLQAGVCL